MKNLIVILIGLFVCSQLQAKEIVTTLPEFSWVAKQLMPDAKVKSLLNGSEDPHFVDASPSFIFKVAKADVLLINGLSLEVGWIPKVITQSGNKKVQKGEQGYCDIGSKINAEGKLKNYDRSMGDVHPEGNPHYSLSPKRMIKVVNIVKDCLALSFPEAKMDEFAKKLITKLRTLSDEMEQVSKKDYFYSYHSEFDYLEKDYGLKFLKQLEKVPGVLPSATHLVSLAKKSQLDKPKFVIASSKSSRKVLNKFKELSGIDFIQLDLHPVGKQSYLDFMRSFMLKLNK